MRWLMLSLAIVSAGCGKPETPPTPDVTDKAEAPAEKPPREKTVLLTIYVHFKHPVEEKTISSILRKFPKCEVQSATYYEDEQKAMAFVFVPESTSLADLAVGIEHFGEVDTVRFH